MKKNNLPKRIAWSVGIAILAVYLVTSVGSSNAEIAVGNAQATVVSPVSVHITATPSLSEVITSVGEANQRAIAGTPVLRNSSGLLGASSPGASPAVAAAAATAEAASDTAVSVTVNPNGSLSVGSSGKGVAYTVTQPADNKVTIEYN